MLCKKKKTKLISVPRSKMISTVIPLQSSAFMCLRGLVSSAQLYSSKQIKCLHFWHARDNLSQSMTRSSKWKSTSNLCIEEGLLTLISQVKPVFTHMVTSQHIPGTSPNKQLYEKYSKNDNLWKLHHHV